MNRIVRKTLDGLERLKPNVKDDDANSIIENLEKAITLDYRIDSIGHLLDSFESINVLLFKACQLTKEEAGFIFNKIMQYNYMVNGHGKQTIITYDSFLNIGFTKEEIEDLLNRYYSGPEKTTAEEKKLMSYVIKTEEVNTMSIKNSYKAIEEFSKKQTHSEEEYNILVRELENLNVPKTLIESYVSYFKKNEKEEKVIKVIKPKEEKKENIPSRRELKNRLNELYHPDEKEPYFDLKDLEEVLKLIKLLSISDERAKIILNCLYKCAIKNDNYYDFLINKIKFMNKHADKIKEIEDLKEMLSTSEEEIKPDIIEWLNSIYSRLEWEMINSFKYESNLAKKYKFVP